MSSISFPSGAGGRPSSPSSSGHHEEFFGSSYNASSSFQMNPLSPHPPRTPKTSVASQSHVYGAEIYTPAEETHVTTVEVDEDIDEEEIRDVREDVKGKVRVAEVWREVLRTSAGRDKAFKIMQYTLRVYLLFHSAVSTSTLLRKPTRSLWEVDLVKRLESTASGLSTTRKCLILFNWLTPLTSILAAQPIEFSQSSSSRLKDPPKPLLHTFLHAPPPVLLDLVNGLSDDIYAFSRLGLIGKRTGERAGKFSDWCWFVGTLVALVELSFERSITKSKIQAVEARLYTESMTGATANSTAVITKTGEKELEKLHRQDFWIRLQRIKLIMDLIFVSYDLFKVRRARDTVRSFAGLTSALLSSAKIYQNHWNSLLIKESQR